MNWWEQDSPIVQSAVKTAQWWEGDVPSSTQPKKSRIESAARGALQGATFGFSDEIGGGLSAAGNALLGDFNLADNYASARDAIREGDKQAQSDNPGAFFVGELAGGVALPFGVARTAARLPQAAQGLARAAGLTPQITQAATLGQRVRQGGKMGAVYGGLYGAGTSEADNAGSFLRDTATGAATGAVIGGATVPAVDLIAATGRAIAAPIRAARDPKGFAAEKIQESLQRDQKVGPRLESRADIAAQADPDTMIADVAGRSTQRLMRSALNQQSERTEPFMLRLDHRKRFEGQKLERALRDGLKVGTDDLYRSADDLAEQMDDIGKRLIEPRLDIETPMTPRLENVLARPKVKELVARAENSLKNEDLPVGLETRTRMLHKVKVLIDDELDALNDIIKSPMSTDRTARTDFRELTIIKRDLLNAIDNPQYKDALRLYSSPARIRSAGIKGKSEFLERVPQEVERDFARLNDAEKKMYRHGAMQAIVERIQSGNVMNDKVRGVLSSDSMMRRVKLLFDDQQEFRKFQRLVVTLARQNKTRQAAQGNSTTAQQLADMQDAKNITEGANQLANAATGNWRGLLDAAGRVGARFQGMNPETAAEALRILSSSPSTSPVRTGILNTPELRKAANSLAVGQKRRNALSQGVTSGLSAATTPLVGRSP